MGPIYYCDVWTLSNIKKKPKWNKWAKKANHKNGLSLPFPSQLKGNPSLLGFLESLGATS